METNIPIPYQDTDENRWRKRLAFVGMFFEVQSQKDFQVTGIIRQSSGGLCSPGFGTTVGDAIRSASVGMRIDWHSVDKKMTEVAWRELAHI